ncbi:MAG TPA: hypothetical protein VGC41_20155, partial [Kofleriaceae bacterium]
MAAPAPVPAPVAELRAVAAKHKPGVAPSERWPDCTDLAKGDRKVLDAQLHQFVDAQHPDEHEADASMENMAFVIQLGCREPDGTVYATVAADRISKAKGAFSTRRNYVLALKGHTVTIVAERTSTASFDWMEWADEGGFQLIAQMDLDHDGKRDLLYADYHHEGGAMSGDEQLIAVLGNGKRTELAQLRDPQGEVIVNKHLVLGAHSRYGDVTVYACLGTDLRMARCPEAAVAQRAADRNAAIDRLAGLENELPDREQLASDLALLGEKRPDLVALMPETTAAQRAGRHVAAFLASKDLDPKFTTLFTQPDPEAHRYLAQLGSQLGDSPCVVTELSPDLNARLVAWAKKQGADPGLIVVAAECGNYAWVQYFRANDPDGHEFLMLDEGHDVRPVQKFKTESLENPMGAHSYIGHFFMHGATVVGYVIHGKNLVVIADGKVVAQSHGEL